MCTVAFVPRSCGYLLGHNRDELRSRTRALPPQVHTIDGLAVLAPRDPDGGGSWIGVNASGAGYCVLNAEEADPTRRISNPVSRGRVLWDTLGFVDVRAAIDSVARRTLHDVRAFELLAISVNRRGQARARRLRWDGSEVTRSVHLGTTLFVSSSFAASGVPGLRSEVWKRLLARQPRPDADAVRDYLASHEPRRGARSVCMHRPEARTVSRTVVEVGMDPAGPQISMGYLEGPPCAPEAPELRSTLHSP